MLVGFTHYLDEHRNDSDFVEKAKNKLYSLLPEDLRDPDFIKGLLRLMEKEQIYFNNGLSVNLVLHVVCLNDEIVNLTPCEIRIIEVLAESPNYELSFEELAHKVWNYDADICNIRVNINNIRKKIGDNIIENVKGKGYRLNVL